MSKHFCCCIPVRFGVFLLSILTLLGAAGTAGLAWFYLIWAPQHNYTLEGSLRIAFIVIGAVYSLFALISLAGLVGAIFRSRALVKTYSIFLWIQLLLSLGLAIYLGIALFNNSIRQRLIDECVNQTQIAQDNLQPALGRAKARLDKSTPEEIRNACEAVWNGSRIGMIVGFSLSLLINLYCCIIVHRYGTQLSEEATFKAATHAASHASTYSHQLAPSHYSQSKDAPSSYYPHAPLGHAEHGQAGYTYPYSQPQHGFGNH